jgi:DNA-binding NarL/FixJ family response regulator
VVADYEAGQSTMVLMERYHLAKGTVLKILDTHGTTRRHQPMTDAEVAEVIRLYQEGWSLARIGKRFDRNPATIHAVLRRAGVPRRKPWERVAG